MSAAKRIIHTVDADVAKKFGVNAGIIYAFIRYFCASKEAEQSERSFHDGRYWIFNSVAGFQRLFPYLSEKQIRNALRALEDAEYIKSGVFNKHARDRTKWYTDLRVSICPQGQTHLPSGADVICPQGQTITQDTQNTTNKKIQKETVLGNLETVLDTEFAKAVIQHRKTLRKPLTELAAKRLAAKFAKWVDPNEAAAMMVERGWQGFEPEWMQRHKLENRNQQSGRDILLATALGDA